MRQVSDCADSGSEEGEVGENDATEALCLFFRRALRDHVLCVACTIKGGQKNVATVLSSIGIS